jgi:hypothetical protein
VGMTLQLEEKMLRTVIPSEVRDLLFVKIQEKTDSSDKTRPRNDKLDAF